MDIAECSFACIRDHSTANIFFGAYAGIRCEFEFHIYRGHLFLAASMPWAIQSNQPASRKNDPHHPRDRSIEQATGGFRKARE